MSPVSDIEREVCAMPKAFRDWFGEVYHAVCSGDGRQMTDDEVRTAMAAWQAASDHTLLREAKEALELVRHRDSRWHDDELVTPLINKINKALGD